MPQGLALLFECQASGIGNARRRGMDSIAMPRGAALVPWVCQVVRHRFHRYTRGSGIDLPLGSLNAKQSGIGYAGGSGIDFIGMPGGLT